MGALREDAKYIYTRAIEAVLPDEAVRRALDGAVFPGRVILVAAGKAAWRNQELALAAAAEIAGTENVVVFSVGSDGTDGPTDAAGGLADGGTVERLAAAGKTVADVLQNNDAYHALRDTGDLIITGPTGTNVNDFAAALVR